MMLDGFLAFQIPISSFYNVLWVELQWYFNQVVYYHSVSHFY